MFKKNNGSWTKSKNPDSKRYKRDMAAHLHGKSLKCVCEKINGIEEIVGKKGALVLRDDVLIVSCGADEDVFSCRIYEMDAWELMSLDGVVITAPDLLHGGEKRTIVAYYSYYREIESN